MVIVWREECAIVCISSRDSPLGQFFELHYSRLYSFGINVLATIS